MNHLIRLSLFLCLTTLPGICRADDVRVFYTGHSFHMFVPKLMGQLTEAGQVKDYKLAGAQGLGGSRVQRHWDLPEDRNKAKKILKEAGTDIFTMAPNVQMPDEGIDRFVELGLKHNPKVRFLVQESWVPGDFLDQRVKDNKQREKTDLDRLRKNQLTWRKQIEAQVADINRKAGRQVVHIVPAGDAVVRLRELVEAGKVTGITNQSELFRDPIGHGNTPITLLTAYCNYACITGQSPVGLKVRATVSNEMNALLQTIAWETVTNYAMSGVKKGS